MRLLASIAFAATLYGHAVADELFTIETVRENVFGSLDVYLRLHTDTAAERAFLECFAIVDDRAVDRTVQGLSDVRDGMRVQLSFLNAPTDTDTLECTLRY